MVESFKGHKLCHFRIKFTNKKERSLCYVKFWVASSENEDCEQEGSRGRSCWVVGYLETVETSYIESDMGEEWRWRRWSQIKWSWIENLLSKEGEKVPYYDPINSKSYLLLPLMESGVRLMIVHLMWNPLCQKGFREYKDVQNFRLWDEKKQETIEKFPINIPFVRIFYITERGSFYCLNKWQVIYFC